MPSLTLDVWSDFACPWCYVGKRRLEAALERFEERAAVAVRWRAFELDPQAPPSRALDGTYAERLARKYGTERARGEEMVRTMTDTGAAEGLELRFDRVQPGNTFDAHRLRCLAGEHGLAEPMVERLFRAYLTEGEPLSERDVLARLAGEVGLDSGSVREALERDDFAQQVRADEARAAGLGIQGVPCFVFGSAGALSGAQPPEILLQALRAAQREPPPGDPLV